MAVETLHVHTGLDGFAFPHGFREMGDTRLGAWVRFDRAAGFMGLEALAQTAAMHVRYLCDFDKHAFLLKVKAFDEYQALIPGVRHDIAGELVARTDTTFSYALSMACAGTPVNRGAVLISVRPYDDLFRADRLKAYYRRRFKRVWGQGRP